VSLVVIRIHSVENNQNAGEEFELTIDTSRLTFQVIMFDAIVVAVESHESPENISQQCRRQKLSIISFAVSITIH
jgi:hypothetical protein